jgi:5'(3')-deoxyribonucleotidase
VVLVHGFAGSASRTWGPAGWPELLADSARRVVAVDLLGHGDGPHPYAPEDYQHLEDHAAAQLPDEPCDGIGFSLGARVLLTLAAREPDRFRRLVLAGLGDNAFGTDRDERLADLLESDDPAELAPQARYFRDQMADGDPRALAAYLRRPGHGPLDEATLGTVGLPVLLVLGDRDFVGAGDRLLAALPDARRVRAARRRPLRHAQELRLPRRGTGLPAARRGRDRERPPRAMSGEFIFGVDLDGVCGDYTAAFRAVVSAERGIDPGLLAEQRSWDFAEWGVSAEQFPPLHRRAVLEHRMFRTMPVMDGAAEALWRLSDAGAWIRLITHRLYVNWGHAVVLEDTAAWLDTAGIPYRDICFLGRKPEVEADVYLDDAPTTSRPCGRRATGPSCSISPTTARWTVCVPAAGTRWPPWCWP